MPDELAYLFNSFKIPDVKECTEGGKVKITEYPGMIARYLFHPFPAYRQYISDHLDWVDINAHLPFTSVCIFKTSPPNLSTLTRRSLNTYLYCQSKRPYWKLCDWDCPSCSVIDTLSPYSVTLQRILTMVVVTLTSLASTDWICWT